MPVTVTYDPDCDQNFRNQQGAAFQQWINQNHRHRVAAGDVDFDEALVLNGLHPTTSTWDSSPVPHVTVRLSNSALRGQQSWYILHWRPNGQSRVAPRPDNKASNAKRRADRKAKKQRQLQRKRDGKDKDDAGVLQVLSNVEVGMQQVQPEYQLVTVAVWGIRKKPNMKIRGYNRRYRREPEWIRREFLAMPTSPLDFAGVSLDIENRNFRFLFVFL